MYILGEVETEERRLCKLGRGIYIYNFRKQVNLILSIKKENFQKNLTGEAESFEWPFLTRIKNLIKKLEKVV